MCDGIANCELGEDERYCTALTNSSILTINSEGDPTPSHQGILLLNRNGQWEPICVNQMTAQTAATICAYMGFSLQSFTLVSPEEFDSVTVVTPRVDTCNYVNITCDVNRCGQRPLLRNQIIEENSPNYGAGKYTSLE